MADTRDAELTGVPPVPPVRATRVAVIDIARTVALGAMVIFHFTFDLEMFGFAPRGTMARAEWIWFARIIAGSFLFLSGASLVLATLGGPVAPRKYLKRLGMIGLAALTVSAGTYVSVGTAFVRFGILHHMFAASILGLLFLRRPAWVAGLLGLCILALPLVQTGPLFASPMWLWLAKPAVHPQMVDYTPILPWFGLFLLGMASAQWMEARGAWPRVAALLDPRARLVRVLSWPGQHSLAVYLIHQPVLFGAVYAARLLMV